MAETSQPPSAARLFSTSQSENLDFTSCTSSSFLNLGQLHLHEIHAMIAQKRNELNVYNCSRELIETQGADCFVFLGDNLFVLRTAEQAKEILQRQIQFFYNELYRLEEEKTAFELKLEADFGGLVERNESATGEENESFAGNDMARMNIVEGDKNIGMAETYNITPRGISNKDYSKFLELLDSLELGEKDDDDLNEEDDQCDETGEENQECNSDGKKHVHFSSNAITGKSIIEKSILRNRNERSPIDTNELKRMDKRERNQKKVMPTSSETLSDIVNERKVEPSKGVLKLANKRKMKKGKSISAWKAKRMGLPESDDME